MELLSLTIFLIYTLVIIKKYGVQKSISDSYYRLPNKWKPIFTFMIWGFAIPLILAFQSVLLFLAVSLISVVGVAPNFLSQKMTYKAHMIGAYGGIILAFFSVIFDMGNILLGIAGILSILILALLKKKNNIWWIEVVAFITIILSILIS